VRGPIEQQLANRLKVLRTAIRLKHSIAADEEINAAIDEEKKKFFKSVQQAKLPASVDVRKVIGG
jgi:hypothetical protein